MAGCAAAGVGDGHSARDEAVPHSELTGKQRQVLSAPTNTRNL